MEGLVSIIIPVHNRQDYIIETLESIQSQTYRKIEVLLVDDHSTDNSQIIIKEFIGKNSDEIHYRLLNSDGYGSNHARNYGLRNCSGDYVQFFDDDDIMCSNYISSRLEYLTKKQLDWVGCDFVHFQGNVNNIICDRGISAIPHNIVSHIYHLGLPTQCFLITRKAADIIGYWDEKVKRMQDMAYFHRLYLNNLKGEWLTEHLFKYRIHNNSITNNQKADTRIEAFKVIGKEWKERGRYDEVKDVLAICICRFWCGSFHEDKTLFLKLFIENYWTIIRALYVKVVLLKTDKNLRNKI